MTSVAGSGWRTVCAARVHYLPTSFPQQVIICELHPSPADAAAAPKQRRHPTGSARGGGARSFEFLGRCNGEATGVIDGEEEVPRPARSQAKTRASSRVASKKRSSSSRAAVRGSAAAAPPPPPPGSAGWRQRTPASAWRCAAARRGCCCCCFRWGWSGRQWDGALRGGRGWCDEATE